MIKLNLQLFGGRGSSGGGGGSGGQAKEQMQIQASKLSAGGQISSTSTGGRIVDEGGGQWYGENDNGTAVSILDGGKSDVNLYRYGSRQVYEVHRYNAPDDVVGLTDGLPVLFATSKSEAMAYAKSYLKSAKGK